MARYLDVHPVDPQPRAIGQAVAVLRDGGLIAYPTDSGFALGAMVGNQRAKDRIREIRRLDDRHHYTLICRDFAQLGQLVHVDNSVFRAVKASTPGPFTFILPATHEVPRRLQHPKKRTVGVRIPDHPVVRALLAELGEPLLSSTLMLPGEDEPMTDGWAVKEELDHVVDVVIDSGECGTEPTTVVDFSSGAAEVVRVGVRGPVALRVRPASAGSEAPTARRRGPPRELGEHPHVDAAGGAPGLEVDLATSRPRGPRPRHPRGCRAPPPRAASPPRRAGRPERLDVLGTAEEQCRQVVQASQLARCVGVVVDPQVGEHAAAVVAGARRLREDRRALPAAGVAAGGIPGQEGGDQPARRTAGPPCRARRPPSPRPPPGPVRMLPWIA